MARVTGLAGLFGRRRFAIRPGTGRISALLARMGHPEQGFRAIHVVGTNGKGSTAAFLSTILTAAGYRTGLFTSPHLINYTERFRIDGTDIDAARLDRLISHLLSIAGPDDTFFELTTALACCYFTENRVEVAILEAGMGGKADATAAITAEATVVTPISLDHGQWLGSTVAAIAAEKAGIAETGSPVICAPQQPEALAAIRSYCHGNLNRLLLAGHDFQAHWEANHRLAYRDARHSLSGMQPGIPGSYQCWNAACALATAELLTGSGLAISAEALVTGINTAYWPGRMERFTLPNGSELLLDGAHNPAGATALAECLRHDQANRSITLVLGVMADKELEPILAALLPLAEHVITVAPNQERSLAADRLAALCADHGCNAVSGGTVEQGIALARRNTQTNDLIVVAGSLFTVGEARALLTGQICNALRG